MTKSLYRLTARSKSMSIIPEGKNINVNYNSCGDDALVKLETRYLELGYEVRVPGEFEVTVDVSAVDIQDAMTWMHVAQELSNVISVVTNSAIEPLQFEHVYDISPNKKEREYVQACLPSDKPTLSSRIVPLIATATLLSYITESQEMTRIQRAIAQYSEALRRWREDSEILVLSHLWMGIEAITPSYLRAYLDERNISKELLAQEWGFKAGHGHMSTNQFLNAAARGILVCQGDKLHHNIAREASDYYEHGLASTMSLYKAATETVVPIAKYLRDAIFAVSRLPEEHRQILSGKPYDTRRGPGETQTYATALIVGKSERLSAEGRSHPYFEVDSLIKNARFDTEKETYVYDFDCKITAVINEGLVMSNTEVQVWDGGCYFLETAAERTRREAAKQH